MKRKMILMLTVVAMLMGTPTAEAANTIGVERLSGNNRIETAIAISDKIYDKSDVVILASTTGEVDSLAGTILAKHKKAPILLITKNSIPDSVYVKIKSLLAKEVYLLGGEGVISKEVENELRGMYKTTRISGNNRAETAVEIAKQIPNRSNNMFLTSGHGSLADALAVGPVSANKKMPILLANRDSLPKETLAEIINEMPESITIIGGKGVVSDKILEQIPAGIKVNRIAGNNRAETAIKIAKEYTNSDKAIIANGYTIADALVGGYLAAEMGAPILLTSANKLDDQNNKFIQDNIKNVTVLGGNSAISATLIDRVQGKEPVKPLPPVEKPSDDEVIDDGHIEKPTTGAIVVKNKTELKKVIADKTSKRQEEFTVKYVGKDIKTLEEVNKLVKEVTDSAFSYNTANYGTWYIKYPVNEESKLIEEITFNIGHRTTDEQEKFIDAEVKRIISQIITGNMSEYDKVKAVHDYIVNNTTYSTKANTSVYDAYVLFKEKKGVCSAYALSFSRMMEEIGIESVYVRGTSKDKNGESGGRHAWNKVKVDGEWYNIDTTWAHPASKWGLHNAYFYFLVSDSRFYKTHSPRSLIELPKATSTKYEGQYDNNFNRE